MVRNRLLTTKLKAGNVFCYQLFGVVFLELPLFVVPVAMLVPRPLQPWPEGEA